MTVRFDTDDPQGILNYAQSFEVPVFSATKKPIPVTVIGPIPEDAEIRTLESKGSNHHVPSGAYIIIGNHDDCYGIQAHIFESTYERESPLQGLQNPNDIEGILERIDRN